MEFYLPISLNISMCWGQLRCIWSCPLRHLPGNTRMGLWNLSGWNNECRTGLNFHCYGFCIVEFVMFVDEWKTNLMSLAIFFHLLCAQHVSDINISIFRSLRLCWWITTSVVFFSVRCVLELLVRLVRFAGWRLQNEHRASQYNLSNWPT